MHGGHTHTQRPHGRWHDAYSLFFLVVCIRSFSIGEVPSFAFFIFLVTLYSPNDVIGNVVVNVDKFTQSPDHLPVMFPIQTCDLIFV